MNYLLSDEKAISNEDFTIRKILYDKFVELPVDFLSRMRHFQPQVGCFYKCGFCSKFSICKSEFWDERSIRNIVAAIKNVAKKYTNDDILLAWDRKEHRIGVNFPYLDNDIAGYLYLDKFVDICHKELGIRTRISTVGFSRHNKQLNEMHKRICNSELLYSLAGVRLSVTQYGRAWEDTDSASIDEYTKDISNFLHIYKNYYNYSGAGSRKMCVELRYNPLAHNSNVIVTRYNGHMVIFVANYLFISNEQNVRFTEAHVIDPYKHSLVLSEKPIIFSEYNVYQDIRTEEELLLYIRENDLQFKRELEGYLFSNRDGIYYSFDPKISNFGNYGFNIYPKTESRKNSGYLITERFLLNSIYEFKKRRGMHLRDRYTNSTWKDVYEVLDICKKISNLYLTEGKNDKYYYINNHVIPLVSVYVKALRDAGYSSDLFFDSKFTIDTGTICNLGRAIKLFKGLTNHINEPLTPTHERNYGRYCSTMKQENYVWKLSASFNDNLSIEKLDLFNTASSRGQTSYMDKIFINGINKKLEENDMKYLYPGAKE